MQPEVIIDRHRRTLLAVMFIVTGLANVAALVYAHAPRSRPTIPETYLETTGLHAIHIGEDVETCTAFTASTEDENISGVACCGTREWQRLGRACTVTSEK